MMHVWAMALMAPSAVLQDPTELVRKVGAKEVRQVWPQGHAPVRLGDAVFEHDGQKFALTTSGLIVGPFSVDGGWADVRQAQAPVPATAPIWRVKVFVLASGNSLDGSSAELWQSSALAMTGPDLERLDRSLALFMTLAEVQAKQRVRLECDVEVDQDTFWFGPSRTFDVVRDAIRPRFNGHAFEAEDRLYRGPYDSVMVVHSVPMMGSGRMEIWDTPVSVLPYFEAGGRHSPSALATALQKEWLVHVRRRATGQWQTSRTPALTSLAEPVETYLGFGPSEAAPLDPGAIQVRPAGEPAPWSQVQSVSKLGMIRDADMLALTGGRKLEFTGSAYVAEGKDRSLLLVPVAQAKLFGERLKPELNATVLGLFEDQGLAVVFSLPPQPTDVAPYELLTLGLKLPLVGERVSAGAVFEGDPASTVFEGAMIGEPVDDKDEGVVTRVAFTGGARIGGMRLWAAEGRHLDLETTPYFKLRIRAAAAEPMMLELRNRQHAVGRIGLFSRWTNRTPLLPPNRVLVSPSGEWVDLVIDLRPILFRGETIDSIWLTSDLGSLYGGRMLGRIDLLVAEAGVQESGPPSVTEVGGPGIPPAADAVDPIARASWVRSIREADKLAQALALLDDPVDLVRLNAADVFTRFEYQPAEAKLAELSRSLEPRIVEMALKALAHQNTESAWMAIRRTLEIGPGDTNRQFAAREFAKRKDHLAAGAFAVLFNARSWRARAAAVEALASVPTREAALIQLVFLQEIDPCVRLAVTRFADVKIEQVARQFLWSCVNDPSDAVRAASYIRLIESPVESFRAEGYKGVRDESRLVRREVVESFILQPKDEHRGALRLAVGDADPRVRAAALRAFAVLPGPVSRDELGAAWTDTHPEVQAALEALKKAKNLGDAPTLDDNRATQSAFLAILG